MTKPQFVAEPSLVEVENSSPRRTHRPGLFPAADILLPTLARPGLHGVGTRAGTARRAGHTHCRPIVTHSIASATTLVDGFAMIDDIMKVVDVPSGIQVAIDIESTPFLAARLPLETVLYELIDNAIAHHDRDEGHVLIELGNDLGRHLFTISDDGPGILAPLWQDLAALAAESSYIPEDGALGGLSLCARIVERHGAKLGLEVRPGQRSTVARLWWPRC